MRTNSSLLTDNNCDIKVSSVLNRNSKEYGKQFLVDGSPETCWSSDQGCPQWIAVKWSHPVKIRVIKVKFQGGFAGSRDTVIEKWANDSDSWETVQLWPIEDSGDLQTLTLAPGVETDKLRILFPKSTDFFGRIIVYELNILSDQC